MNLPTQSLGAAGDVIFLACFSAAALIPFATYLVLLLAGVVSLPPAKRKGAGRRLFGPLFIGFYYWLLGPLLRLANRSGLRPNHLHAIRNRPDHPGSDRPSHQMKRPR